MAGTTRASASGTPAQTRPVRCSGGRHFGQGRVQLRADEERNPVLRDVGEWLEQPGLRLLERLPKRDLSGAVVAATSAKAAYNYGPMKNGTRCCEMSANGWNNQGFGFWNACPNETCPVQWWPPLRPRPRTITGR